jgi:prepilin-type processing-associated H-X9-DG protein
LSQITDGLSQTALVGEWLVSERTTINFGARRRRNWLTAESFGPGQNDQFIQACVSQQFQIAPSGHPVGFGTRGVQWMEGGAGQTMYSHCISPNNISCSNGGSIPFGAYTLASNHPGGVMVAHADGHLEFYPDAVDLVAWRALGTRNGGEVAR